MNVISANVGENNFKRLIVGCIGLMSRPHRALVKDSILYRKQATICNTDFLINLLHKDSYDNCAAGFL